MTALRLSLQPLIERYLPQGSLRQRYLGGTFWFTLGVGGAQAATFVATIVAARLLGTEAFGRFGIIQSTLGMFGLVAGLGMGLTNKRYVSELRESDPLRCGQVIAFSTSISWFSAGAMALGLILFAPLLAGSVINAPDLVLELRIAAALMLLNGLNDAQLGALSGFEVFKRIALIYALRAGLTLVLLIGGVWLWGLPGLVGGMALTAACVWGYTGLVLRQVLHAAGVPVSYQNVWREGEVFLKFTAPALATSFLPAISFWVIRTVLVNYPDGYAQLGLFTAAEQWVMIMAFVPGAMNNVSLPILSNTYASKDRPRFRKAVVANLTLPVALSVVMAAVVALAAPWVAQVYGRSFAGMAPVLAWMCLVGVLRVFGGAVGSLVVAINRMWASFAINVLWGAVLVAAAIFFAPYGALGLAWANLVAYTLQSLLGLWLFARTV